MAQPNWASQANSGRCIVTLVSTPTKIWLGRPYPLGATWRGNGVNFALYSENATAVDLCLFDSTESPQEETRIRMKEQSDEVWHIFLPDIKPGQLYGYRVHSSNGVTGGQVQEFKTMVKNLHAAGIEVLLDVVYNHTAEGNHMGPTLCFKGIENYNYYRLVPDNLRYYMDYTGTGNTLNVMQARSLQLIMDSLRYWVTEMHVDGFRFDLAATLARELHAVSKLSAFFDIIHQDPVLSQVKLIAEPWDVGEGGYQVGNFPVLWAEWNGKYRDSVRSYWKGNEGLIGEMAYLLTGSPDLYEWNGKRPQASINFVTAHDGFTLSDLVSYNDKHNDANGENNQDGDNNNQSWNCGAEGPTKDEQINALRRRQQRNFLCTLFLSQGVPMLCGGDEYGRTQQGNNNAYCQDNEISWTNWDWDKHAKQLHTFTSRLIHLRREHPIFRRPKFFQGRKIRGLDIKDIMWFNPGGTEMGDEEWETSFVRTLGVMLSGDTIDVLDFYCRSIQDDTYLMLFNAHYEPLKFVLPGQEEVRWELIIDTTRDAYCSALLPSSTSLLSIGPIAESDVKLRTVPML